MNNNQAISSRELFSQEVQKVFDEWECLVANIIKLYSHSIDVIMHSNFATDDETKLLRDITRKCYSFIGDVQSLI